MSDGRGRVKVEPQSEVHNKFLIFSFIFIYITNFRFVSILLDCPDNLIGGDLILIKDLVWKDGLVPSEVSTQLIFVNIRWLLLALL